MLILLRGGGERSHSTSFRLATQIPNVHRLRTGHHGGSWGYKNNQDKTQVLESRRGKWLHKQTHVPSRPWRASQGSPGQVQNSLVAGSGWNVDAEERFIIDKVLR